jgi:hypothetical protein
MLERFFRTLDTMLAQKLPGYTYDPKVMGELDYDPTEHAFLTRWELEELISEAIAVYHITDHSSLGMPPARAWEISLGSHKPNVLRNPHVLDHLLGTTKRLRLNKNGVNLEGIFYRDAKQTFELLNDLAGIQKAGDRLKSSAAAWVKVRFNEEDLSQVHIWNERTSEYVTVEAVNQRYVEGLNLFQHRQIRSGPKIRAVSSTRKLSSSPRAMRLMRGFSGWCPIWNIVIVRRSLVCWNRAGSLLIRGSMPFRSLRSRRLLMGMPKCPVLKSSLASIFAPMVAPSRRPEIS